jgi:hypothetical protein
MHCRTCRGVVDESTTFCPSCGTSNPAWPEQSRPIAPARVRAPQPQPEVKKVISTPVDAGAQRAHIQDQTPVRCKVCDRGVLVSKKVYRMSGPVVAIGYILLIPSILGIIVSVLMFAGVTANRSGSATNESPQSFSEGFDSGFRRSCANKFDEAFQKSAGTPAPALAMEAYCECALSTFKETKSEATTTDKCGQQLQEGSLTPPDLEVQGVYSKIIESNDAETTGQKTQSNGDTGINPFQVIGGGFAVFLGIAFFVGGLLGWLLVMKKRVLQCSVCGAIVNAS